MSTPPTEPAEIWAIVELMGHARTAGRVSIAANFGGLLRVDVPSGEAYRTEFYGIPAIYAVRTVSEEIARACVQTSPAVVPFSAPVITKAEHHEQIQAVLREQRALMPGYEDDGEDG